MNIITRVFPALIAVVAAAIVFVGAAFSDDHDRDLSGKRSSYSGEQEISPFEFVVNIAQKTNLELKDMQRLLRDREYLHQAAALYVPNGPQVGYVTVQRSPIYGFFADNRDPSKSDKALRRDVKRAFSNFDPKIERIEKFRSRKGYGRIAFLRVEGTLCLHGSANYTFSVDDDGIPNVFDTGVTVSYCDPFGRTDQIIEFLKDVKLVTPADNRAAYALRASGTLAPATVTSSESDEEIEARVSQVRAFQKKGLISEQEADEKIRKIRAE